MIVASADTGASFSARAVTGSQTAALMKEKSESTARRRDRLSSLKPLRTAQLKHRNPCVMQIQETAPLSLLLQPVENQIDMIIQQAGCLEWKETV
jgi:hypothetical protein